MDNTSITLKHFIFSGDIGKVLVPCIECNLSQLDRKWKYCHITRPIANCLPIQIDSKKRWHADPENFRQHKTAKYRPKVKLNIPGKHLITEKFCKALGTSYRKVWETYHLFRKHFLEIKIGYENTIIEGTRTSSCTIEIEQYNIKWSTDGVNNSMDNDANGSITTNILEVEEMVNRNATKVNQNIGAVFEKLANKIDIDDTKITEYISRFKEIYLTGKLLLTVITDELLAPLTRRNEAIKNMPTIHHKVIKKLHKDIWIPNQAAIHNLEYSYPENRTPIHIEEKKALRPEKELNYQK
ncbi:19236_t:CDS:2, partial [Gigaspora rosea]